MEKVGQGETVNTVKVTTILDYYKSCLKKINLYREKVQYGTDE